MKRQDIQALFSDLDGTLINNQQIISAENKQAIQAFVNNGGLFTVATGRSELVTPPFIRDIPVNIPAVLYNGAAVYDFNAENFLWKQCLDNDIVQELLRDVMNIYPQVCAEAFMGGPTRFINDKGIMDPYVLQENRPYEWVKISDCSDCIKILLYGEPDQLHKIADEIKDRHYINSFTYMFSAPFYLEILPKGISKNTALQWILHNCLKSIKAYSAIGDYDNDVDMVRYATLGAAPDNAEEVVKAVADVIVGSNDHHALADLISNHIL